MDLRRISAWMIVSAVITAFGGCGREQAQASVPAPEHTADAAAIGEATTDDLAAGEITEDLLNGIADPSKPQVQSVLEGRRLGLRARFDPLAEPAPFDAEAFAADPAAYLDTTEPARAYQTHPPDAVTPRLRPADSRSNVSIASGSTLPLQIQAMPGAPVSFFAGNGGLFLESTLGSVTVQADDAGVARATFLAHRGVGGIATVVAGSPSCVGTVDFLIHIAESSSAVSERR